ncbi:response regulator [Thiomicrorhabdus sp. 6S2-11]|uniref:Response regulator n=1 Tax=Thiomicrorhabdus marina TaxID=2818442 RepID=A0ABS3Q7I7_9GAMM|nr:response regulator [Thiomicrorhabdus marina]MBO1928221.1 response regulator [Thiomicrorhabdus marina]
MYKILAIDDEPINLQIIGACLSNDYQLFMAKDGNRGMQLALKNKPDLILLDIVMPDLNGYEVAKMLKDNPQTRKIPIIFASGKTKSQIQTDVEHVGYISKPYNKAELLTLIANTLS